MRHLIIGHLGEVGRAHYELLKRRHEVYGIDKREVPTAGEEKKIPQIDILHIAIRYDKETFSDIIRGYVTQFKPRIVDILTTVPPRTTESFGPQFCHSTTRGLHPNLSEGLLAIPKHIGGPQSKVLAREFEAVGITCVVHKLARTTEVAHLLNNVAFGVNLMLADELAKVCRQYGVDYFESVMQYTQTNNLGFSALDHASKQRMILTPPQGRIGGHCVTQAANMLNSHASSLPLIEALADYGSK